MRARMGNVGRRITDKQRLDFLDSQSFTKWVGYVHKDGYTVWPVFGCGTLRQEIDRAIKQSAAVHRTSRRKP